MARLFVALQYLLPHHLLCRLAYALTRSRRAWLKDALIGAFVRHYRPRMSDALEPDPHRYDSFNAFFTRALAAGARPLDPDPARILSPCDAVVSLAGTLQGEQLLQAKGHRYSLQALLAGAPEWTQRLRGGSFATLYLAPRDYHRVHMPLEGRLQAAWHVPGRLFSVNAATTERVPGLFARNERLICAFDSPRGSFVVVLVGALFVGSIQSIWHGEVTPWRTDARAAAAAAGAGTAAGLGAGVHPLQPGTGAELWQPRGAELGRFNMGSTVIVLLPPGLAAWDPRLVPGAAVQAGAGLGVLR
jgi:phosphatidylserine decarboxylase